MADIAKRETRAEKERNRNEARVGLASNILGITAGTAALATASRNKAFRTGSVADAGPVTRRIAQRSKGRIGPKGVGRLVRAGAAGAVALQAANLGGDLIANRVLAREAQQKVKKDMRARNDQSVSAPVMGHGETGHGSNLELVGKADRMKCPKCDCECTSKGKCPECGMDCRKIEKAAALKMGRVKCPNCEIPCDAEGKCPMCGKDCRAVAKAMRRFDSEADRQRRLGLYTGAGLATAAVAGDAARRQFTPVEGEQPRKNGKFAEGKKPVRGIALKPGVSPRKAAALAALALGGAAVGAGSYKRGVSRRNQPWA
jgi:hypothetical protein